MKKKGVMRMNRKNILFYGLEEEKTKKRKLKKWAKITFVIIIIVLFVILGNQQQQEKINKCIAEGNGVEYCTLKSVQ